MRNFKQMTAIGLSVLSIAQCFSPVFAEGEVTNTISEAGSLSSDVTYSQDSSFTVSIPKKIALGSNKSATYNVNVTGDIYGDQTITVTPDATVTLTDKNGKDDVIAVVTQDDTVFECADIKAVDESGEMVGKTVEGNITASDLTSGNWSGILNFTIASKENNNSITVKAKNASGEDLNASASEITGDEKETLISSLVETGMINSAEDVNALIEVESDDFDGIAETTFNVSSIANAGDKVAILHFNEITNEWEYIGTETVDTNGIISGDFTSYSPVAFVKINENGNYETVTKQAGLYDDNDNLLCSWEDSGIDVEKDYTIINYDTVATSPYYVLKNNYPAAKKVVIPNSITSIGSYAFCSCTSLTSIIIPDSVTSIRDGAFNNCTSLTSIIIPDSITSIKYSIFNNCTSLTSVAIPDSVTSIENFAFEGCSSLTSVTIPDSVTSIGNNVFYICTSLTSIIVDKNNPNYCSVDGVLFNKDKSTLICYPSGKKDASYIIPDSVTNIRESAFDKCLSLTSATIPNSVTSIERYTFHNCTSLTSVTIPNSVTSIGTYAFENCTSLTSVTIPNSVTSIKDGAFYDCTSLASVIIPGSVTSIESGAFYNCSKLTNAKFETTSGWRVGIPGVETKTISSANLANTSTAATYLRSTYCDKYWTR